jgi:hypothetical protein
MDTSNVFTVDDSVLQMFGSDGVQQFISLGADKDPVESQWNMHAFSGDAYARSHGLFDGLKIENEEVETAFQRELIQNDFDTAANVHAMFAQSVQPAGTRNFSNCIEKLISFARRCNIKANYVSGCLKRAILASLKLVQLERVSTCIRDGQPFGELKRFMEQQDANFIGDYHDWETLLHALTFDEEMLQTAFSSKFNFGKDFPTIYTARELLHEIDLNLSLQDLMKVYLLCNVKSLKVRHSLENYFLQILPVEKNAGQLAMVYSASLADKRFSAEEFSADLAFTLDALRVQPWFEEKVIRFLQDSSEMVRLTTKRVKEETTGRVKLRERIGESAQRRLIGGGAVALATPTANDLVSSTLEGWSQLARLPPMISERKKLTAYMLISLPLVHASKAEIEGIIQTNFDPTVADSILKTVVGKPEASVIVDLLSFVSTHVQPFRELTEFREQCFATLSFKESSELQWVTLFQLYVAMYQRETLWRAVWMNFHLSLSHQITVAVNKFRSQNKFALQEVAEICLYDTLLHKQPTSSQPSIPDIKNERSEPSETLTSSCAPELELPIEGCHGSPASPLSPSQKPLPPSPETKSLPPSPEIRSSAPSPEIRSSPPSPGSGATMDAHEEFSPDVDIKNELWDTLPHVEDDPDDRLHSEK